jgi:hypothetical protein
MLNVTPADKAVLPGVDHIVYSTQDFNAAVARLERLLSIRASLGGRHPGGGTVTRSSRLVQACTWRSWRQILTSLTCLAVGLLTSKVYASRQ